MRVLMVCLGNICRSPMAEGWLIHKAKQYGIAVVTDSAGTASYHIGEKPDQRMRKHALSYGISLENLRARQFNVEDFDRFDVIFAMDKSNFQNIIKLARNSQDKEKVKLYLNELYPHTEKEVPDPYYGDAQGFDDVIQLLELATEAFLKNQKLI